jgi:ankyrin repeat protein
MELNQNNQDKIDEYSIYFNDFDTNIEYKCSQFTKSKGFTKLMYLLINANNIDHRIITKYIIENKNEINKINDAKWTALHIACRNSRLFNLEIIIQILLKNGADSNFKSNNDEWTALMSASRNSNTESNFNTVKILIDYGGRSQHKR